MLRRAYHMLMKVCIHMQNVFSEFQAKILYIMLGKKKTRILKTNERFRGQYKGNRCFVLGNGPSLKQQDLSLLKDEYVFTVNEIMRDDRFEQLQTNFHLFADEIYYKMDLKDEKCNSILQLIRKLGEGPVKPYVFFPIQGEGSFKELELENIEKCYFFSGCNMYEKYKKDIDYAKSVPGVYTVVQYAIMLAFYMGFSEVYLLGCDMTGYQEFESIKLKKYNEDTHCYKLKKEEIDKKLEVRELSCEAFFKGYTQMLIDYRRLNEFANRKGIRLINLTPGGMLDCIPRGKYEELFGK